MNGKQKNKLIDLLKRKGEFTVGELSNLLYGNGDPANRWRTYSVISEFQRSKAANLLRISKGRYAIVNPTNGNFSAIVDKINRSDDRSDAYVTASDEVIGMILEHLDDIEVDKLVDLLSNLDKRKHPGAVVQIRETIKKRTVKA